MKPLHTQAGSQTTLYSDLIQVTAGEATISLYFGNTIPGNMAVDATATSPAIEATPKTNKLNTHQVITKKAAIVLMQRLAEDLNYTVTEKPTKPVT